MKKIKLFSIVAFVVCLVMAFSILVSACGAKDYSSYTYSDWKAITYDEWNGKTIKYQAHTNTTEGNRMDVGFGAQGCYTQVLLNLYEDGTAAYFQAGIYDTGAPNQVWYDKDNYISWAQFGLWEEADNQIKVYLLTYFSDDLTVTKDSSFIEKGNEDIKVYVATLTAVDGAYKYDPTAEKGNFEGFTRFGINDNGEGMGIDQEMVTKTGSDIEYNKIQDWVNTYINDTKGVC